MKDKERRYNSCGRSRNLNDLHQVNIELADGIRAMIDLLDSGRIRCLGPNRWPQIERFSWYNLFVRYTTYTTREHTLNVLTKRFQADDKQMRPISADEWKRSLHWQTDFGQCDRKRSLCILLFDCLTKSPCLCVCVVCVFVTCLPAPCLYVLVVCRIHSTINNNTHIHRHRYTLILTADDYHRPIQVNYVVHYHYLIVAVSNRLICRLLTLLFTWHSHLLRPPNLTIKDFDSFNPQVNSISALKVKRNNWIGLSSHLDSRHKCIVGVTATPLMAATKVSKGDKRCRPSVEPGDTKSDT